MGNLRLYGSTSGYVEIAPPAVAGTTTLTMPAGAWTAYTPTVAGYTGSIGTVTINSAAYQSFGKQITGRIDVTFAPGTAATLLTVTLPVNALSTRCGCISGMETAVAGWVVGGYNDTNSRMVIAKYDGTAPWSGTGNNRIVATFIYESA